MKIRVSRYLLTILFLIAWSAQSQEVVLNPASITGVAGVESVSWTDVTIRGFSDNSPNGQFTAEIRIASPASTTPFSAYDLTVQVEQGNTRLWEVEADFYKSEGSDTFDRLILPRQQAEITDGEPPFVMDFLETSPCFLEGQIFVSGDDYQFFGGIITATKVPDDGTVGTTRTRSNAYSMPLPPGVYQVEAILQIGPPATAISVETIEIECPADSVAQNDYLIEPPSAKVAGTIRFPGPPSETLENVVDQYFLDGTGGQSTINRCAPASWPCNLLDNLEPFELGPVPDGTYSIRAQAFLNNGDDFFQFPASAYSGGVEPGSNQVLIDNPDDVALEIAANQAFIEGTLLLTGVGQLDIATRAVARAISVTEFPSSASDVMSRPSGDMDLVTTEGTWAMDYTVDMARPASDPDGFLNQRLRIQDRSFETAPLETTAFETTYIFPKYCTGSLTVNFSVLGEQTLSHPYLTSASCRHDDPVTTDPIYTAFITSTPDPLLINEDSGKASIIGPEGHCANIRALATVAGSLTTFDILETDMECDVRKEIEIGGPSLSIDPIPSPCIDLDIGDELLITGSATDDAAVESISVNGIPAQFASTNNANDPAEVEWMVSIPITSKGPLTLYSVVTDTQGLVASDTRVWTIDSAPPTLEFFPRHGEVFSLADGTSVSVEGTSTDDAGVPSVTVNGIPAVVAEDGTFAMSSVNIDTCGAVYPCDTAITVVSSDQGCHSVTQSHIVTLIENQQPTAIANGPYYVPEGGSVQLMGTGADPDGDPIEYAWDLDGEPGFETEEQNPVFSAVGLDGPTSLEVTLVVTDEHGSASTSLTTIYVVNVAPEIETITTTMEPVPVGTAVSFEAPFIDPGLPDTHTAVWSFGDGNHCDTEIDLACLVDEIPGSGMVSAEHAYNEAGVYTVSLTVTDDDQGADTEVYQFIVVYDPDGGFVTGGGFIDSPAGALVANPEQTGTANFGFVSKYLPGRTTPSGSTEFQFQAGNLNFHSGEYDWLLVSGHRAQFKGTGTINRQGNYGFLLTAVDAKLTPSTSVDKFRIKIWDKDNNDAIVYDNQMGEDDYGDAATGLTAGSIVIHTKGN